MTFKELLMRSYDYLVTFKTGKTEVVNTNGTKCAKILAQALQIDKGHRYEVKSIERL